MTVRNYEPKSELARYAFGYSDKKPGLAFWIIHGLMDERAADCFLDQHGAVYRSDGRQWNHLSESMSTLVIEQITPAKKPEMVECEWCGEKVEFGTCCECGQPTDH